MGIQRNSRYCGSCHGPLNYEDGELHCTACETQCLYCGAWHLKGEPCPECGMDEE